MNETVIHTEKLTKKFGNFTAVDNISFSVEKGEIFGFLGANGAGKTTAMRMLCGLSYPSSGQGFVAGMSSRCETEICMLIHYIDNTRTHIHAVAYFHIISFLVVLRAEK